MIYVSLPVHEHPEVVIDQCLNFQKYLKCLIVLHVPKAKDDLKSNVKELLAKNSLTQRVFINPVSVDTGWGKIIGAHLSNIDFIIRNLKARQKDKVVFHSSNDMLVKNGLTQYLSGKQFIFQERTFVNPGFWLPGKYALEDEALRGFIVDTFGKFSGLCGSQLEGSMYLVEMLNNLQHEINRAKLTLSSIYPIEEIIFPTFAKYLNANPCVSNYIFSEVNRVDKDIFCVLSLIRKIMPALSTSEFILRVLSYIVNKQRKNKNKIAICDVDDIRNCKYKNFTIPDAGNSWELNATNSEIFGVKRIKRSLSDPIRLYINSLDFSA